MSEDLIKRSDAIKALNREKSDWNCDYNVPIDNCIKRLNKVKSADRPQGEWIRTGRTNIYGGIEVQCSNCGDRVMVQHLEDEWYCRHCGADMGMKGADDDSKRD